MKKDNFIAVDLSNFEFEQMLPFLIAYARYNEGRELLIEGAEMTFSELRKVSPTDWTDKQVRDAHERDMTELKDATAVARVQFLAEAEELARRLIVD